LRCSSSYIPQGPQKFNEFKRPIIIVSAFGLWRRSKTLLLDSKPARVGSICNIYTSGCYANLGFAIQDSSASLHYVRQVVNNHHHHHHHHQPHFNTYTTTLMQTMTKEIQTEARPYMVTPTLAAWSNAIESFKRSLPAKDLKNLTSSVSPDELVAQVKKWSVQKQNRSARAMTIIEHGVARMNRFGNCIDQLCQGLPDPACFLWGSIKFVLVVSYQTSHIRCDLFTE